MKRGAFRRTSRRVLLLAELKFGTPGRSSAPPGFLGLALGRTTEARQCRHCLHKSLFRVG